MLNKINKKLLIILGVALLVRVIGIDHGFPFIFHPDEPAVVRSATGIRFNPNPDHFDWPHLHFYLNFILFTVFTKFRGLLQALNLRGNLEGAFPILWRDPLVFYYISRLFDAILGAFTVIPVYLTGKKLWGERAGLLAGVTLAVMPFHVWTSHYALIDIPTAFWLAWALFFSVKIFYERNFHHYILAGLFIGLAASTKYNGGLFALMIPLAHILRVVKSEGEVLIDKEGILMVFYSGLFAFFGFVLGTPYSVLDFDTFIRSDSPSGALWQFKNVGKVGFVTQIQQFFDVILFKIPDDFGYTPLIAYFASAFVFFDVLLKSVVENKKKKISENVLKVCLVLIPSLFVIFYISGFVKTRSHYYLITYPFVAVISGYVVHVIWERLERKKKTAKKIKPFLYAFFAVPVAMLAYNLLLFVRHDTRQVLYNYMLENLAVGVEIYYDGDTFYEVISKFDNETNPSSKLTGVGNDIFENALIIVDMGDNDPDLDRVTTDLAKKTTVIKSTLRTGPDIIIYEL